MRLRISVSYDGLEEPVKLQFHLATDCSLRESENAVMANFLGGLRLVKRQ